MQKIKQDLNIGPNLSRLRHSLKLSQEQVAAQLQLHGCEISRSIYSKMETGRYPIRVSELIVLTKIFRCQFNDLFVGLDK